MHCFVSLQEVFNTFFILLVLGMSTVCNCEQVVQSIGGKVGGGNFTYYTLKQEGTVSLILDTLSGDTDIYASETNTKPDYLDYDLQSATCGQDIVTIPKKFERPVGIGIYGHVYHQESEYVLTVVLDYDSTIPQEQRIPFTSYYGEDAANESPLWIVFVNIIKIILEILV